MKLQINLTDTFYDLERFSSADALQDLLEEFDGIELMHMEDDPRGIISDDMVVGYHFSQPEYWLDFYNGRMDLCAEEFDTQEKAAEYYKGSDPSALVRHMRSEYDYAVMRKARYMVVHVSDAGAFEEITGRYHYSDEEVIRRFCDLMNEALPAVPGGPLLLMENLWQPGLTFQDPELTAMLLENIKYPEKGLMLDTGHLMHTAPELKTQKEAVEYIHRRLDEHGDLCRFIRGIHLNQSLTGRIMKKYHRHPPVPAATWEERTSQLFEYIFQVDLHRPFVGEGVKELVERINPDYMTFEFITNNLEEHKKMLKRQRAVFKN